MVLDDVAGALWLVTTFRHPALRNFKTIGHHARLCLLSLPMWDA